MGHMSSISPGSQPTPAVVAGRYELLQVLGNGSFGRTYLARDRTSGRHVAIKLLDPRTVADWKSIERFEREAAVLQTLRHQGIPEFHELLHEPWEGANATFLVMEYIEGVSLAQMIAEQRTLDGGTVLDMFLELLGVLDYLHSRVPPVLHRDIKPANIIVRPSGHPALVDFGAVRATLMQPDEFGSTVAGTFGYMPYEQYMGQASAASDLYALAATFLHLMTGRPPRDFMSDAGQIDVPASLPGDARLGPILERMLRRAPAERFNSARDVRQALLAGTAVAPAGAGAAPGAPAAVRTHASTSPVVQSLLATAAPREMRGDTKKALGHLAPSMLQLMNGTSKKGDKAGILDWTTIAFFSVVTAGVLPFVFLAMARARRRRLKRFLRDGTAAVGAITEIVMEKGPFDSPMARVAYEFTVDGVPHRDVDQMLPAIASRWRAGDSVQILYIADDDYDSVIISTS